MANTIPELRQWQIGKETDWGTAVAATAKLQLLRSASITPKWVTKLPQNIGGDFAPSKEAYQVSGGGSAQVEQVATYEDINYWLEGLFGVVVPAGVGPYVRDGNAPAAATAPTLRYHTLIGGETASDVRKLAGCVTKKVVIKGEVSETEPEMIISVELEGKQASSGALAGLSDRTLNPILMSHIALYIDAWGGAMGATEILTTMFAFELTLDPGMLLARYNKSLYPQEVIFKRPNPGNNKLKLSLALNTATAAYLTTIHTPSLFQKQVRIKATDSTRIMQFDFAGTSEAAPKLYDEKNGISIVDFELSAEYNSALANWFKYSNTNAVAVLP